jgi:hypothetical protein
MGLITGIEDTALTAPGKAAPGARTTSFRKWVRHRQMHPQHAADVHAEETRVIAR